MRVLCHGDGCWHANLCSHVRFTCLGLDHQNEKDMFFFPPKKWTDKSATQTPTQLKEPWLENQTCVVHVHTDAQFFNKVNYLSHLFPQLLASFYWSC